MPIPKVQEPTSAFGAGDFWYNVGLMSYPTAKFARPIREAINIGAITASIAEITNVDITQTFTSANGTTPQTSPESKLVIDSPTPILLIYMAHFWYDANNASTTVAKIFRQILVNDAALETSKGMFHEISPGKGFESVTRDEVFFAEVEEFALLPAGRYEVQHQLWVENAADLTGDLQVKFMDRAWLGYGQVAKEVSI